MDQNSQIAAKIEFILEPERNLCTNLKFDFNESKWTDHEFLEDPKFEENWKRKYDDFWYNMENIHPRNPYQPGKTRQLKIPKVHSVLNMSTM